MQTEMICHLVDLCSIPSIAMSLPMRYLQASAEADTRLRGRCDFSQQCRYPAGIEEETWQTIGSTLERDRGAKHVVAFTSYCWNSQLNLRFAKRLRTAFPDTLIVFGGNDVAHQTSWIFGDGSDVDVLVNGEGERVFPNILAAYLEAGDRMAFDGVPGVSFRNGDGRIVTTAPQPLIHNLDDIPSPYYGEAGDDIARSKAIISEFSRGCPFECSFCNWGGAIGTPIRRFSLARIGSDLEFQISHMRDGTLMYIADSNFGMTAADLESAQLLVETAKRLKKRIYVFTNFAKNTNRYVIETAKVLYYSGLISMVTLSAQSLNPEVLAIAQRKYMPFENFRKLQDEFRELGIPTYTELLIGMPGESYDSFLNGIERVIETGGRPVIYTLLLLNNTHYARPEVRERYGLRSKMVPFHSLDMSLRAETSVGHDKLTFEEWILCVGLMIVVPIFYFGILRFVIERLRSVYGVPYGRMLDQLTRYCLEGRLESHPQVRRLFLNYVETWREPADYDTELLRSITGTVDGYPGPHHYQAIMRALMNDVAITGALVEELAHLLAALAERPVDPAELETWIAYQKLIVAAMAQAAGGAPGEVSTDCDVETLRRCAGSTVLIEENGRRKLRVRPKFKRYTFTDFLFQHLYGTFNTLTMFECAGETGPVSPPALPLVPATGS